MWDEGLDRGKADGQVKLIRQREAEFVNKKKTHISRHQGGRVERR